MILLGGHSQSLTLDAPSNAVLAYPEVSHDLHSRFSIVSLYFPKGQMAHAEPSPSVVAETPAVEPNPFLHKHLSPISLLLAFSSTHSLLRTLSTRFWPTCAV